MYPILLWFPLCLLMTMYTSAEVGSGKLGNKCGSGQYKSDFLSGSCAKCPKILRDCEDQEIDDAVRCFNVCGRILSTSQASKPTTFQDRRWSAPPLRTTPTTKAPTITFVIEVHENFSKNHYARFKNTLIQPTSSYLSDKLSSNSNNRDIIFGTTLSIVALVLLLGVFFALFWKRRRNNTNDEQPRSSPADYTAVALDSKSNSNEDIEASGQTKEQVDVRVVESSINIPSVSLEGLNNMTETVL